jgi:hypothetical protein
LLVAFCLLVVIRSTRPDQRLEALPNLFLLYAMEFADGIGSAPNLFQAAWPGCSSLHFQKEEPWATP